MDSFRCIRASRLLLDYPLHGTGALPPDLQRIVEDATFTAFERVIDECLAHQVDCLLISGDCFELGESDSCGHSPTQAHIPAGAAPVPTVRGAAALARGFSRLQEPEVAVIVQRRGPDPWDLWPAGLRLPPNVHLLDVRGGASVPVARAGKLLATITADHAGTPSSSGWRVQLPLADRMPETVHVTEDSRGTQGIRPRETGPRGCTLIEIDSEGAARETLLPVAPVRWEQFEIKVAAETSRDDLLQDMASLLEQSTRNACEAVWLVGWDVVGEGALLASLREPTFRDRFLADLSELGAIPHARLHTASLRLHAVPSVAPADALAADCVERLNRRFARRETALAECLAASALCGGPWEVRLESLLAELDAGEVAHDACRMSMQWFAGREELSS